MIVSYSHGREFMDQIKPVLKTSDTDVLARFVAQYWPNGRLRALLTCGHKEAAQVAAFCLMLTGTMEDTPAVAALLHDDDVSTAATAEHTMWSIWFRAGDKESNRQLVRAVQAIGENQLEDAKDLLTSIVARSPDFAEAYNQRAIVYFLMGDYRRSADDCVKTIRLNPYHFGALAGLGHCYASMGKLTEALEGYRRVLELHPRAEGIRQSIQQIRETLQFRAIPAPRRISDSDQAFPAA